MTKHFTPLALDTYFLGTASEVEFCSQVQAGGNHLVVATASGKPIVKNRSLRLRKQDLSGVLSQFNKLPESDRRPKIVATKEVTPKRPVPKPPVGGLRLRGYCNHLSLNGEGEPVRKDLYYYGNQWKAETQSDILWLTEDESKNLVPKDPKPGRVVEVGQPIQYRFFSTIGIDYMEGSVHSLPVRESTMAVTVEGVDETGVTLRLDGYGRMGIAYDETSKRDEPHTRGCELRVLGKLHCDRSARFDRFELVGIGSAWGNKMKQTQRSLSIEGNPWVYGIACELIKGDDPIDRVPPYNLLHYNGGGKRYFGN